MMTALFLVVPSAQSGKVPPSSSLSVGCVSAGVGSVDICTIAPETGLSKTLRYTLEVVDGCGVNGVFFSQQFTADQLAAGLTVTVDDAGGCSTFGTFTSLWTFSLYSSTTRTPIVVTLVATGTALDGE